MEKENLKKNKDFLLVQDFVIGAERARTEKIDECCQIQNLYSEQFKLGKNGNKKALNGFLLFQSIWKTISKMRVLDYGIKSSSASKELCDKVHSAVDYLVQQSNFTQAFTEKSAVFFRSLLFGDAFLKIGANTNSSPIKFEICSISDLWFNSDISAIRSESGNIDAQEMAVSYYYSPAEFQNVYPEFAKKKISGLLPWNNQQEKLENDLVQVVHYYSKSSEKHLVLAGSQAVVLHKAEGEDYPFRDKNKKAYLPILHFICFPTIEGLYNAGLGSLLYNLHIETRRLMNMAISAINNRVDPLYTMTMKKSKIAEFQNWVYKALEAKSRGEMGIVPMEVDESGQPEYGKVQSLIGEQISGDFDRLFAKYDTLIKRLGINLDDLDYVNDTAKYAIFREENANGFVRQIMEQNAGEFAFAIECILTSIRDFVAHDNADLIDKDGTTLGMISEILEKYNFEVEIDSRSGAYPVNSAELARIDEVLTSLPTGSAAYNKAILKKSKILGMDISVEDLKA